MELYNTVSGCGETIGYFTGEGAVVFILSFVIFTIAIMTAFLYFCDRIFGEKNWFKGIEYEMVPMLIITLIWLSISYFIVGLFFNGADAYSNNGAREILAERLKVKAECVDAAVFYGANIEQLSPNVLRNYNGVNPKIYDEIINRYSIGVGGFEKDTDRALFFNALKEVKLGELEAKIPAIPLHTQNSITNKDQK